MTFRVTSGGPMRASRFFVALVVTLGLVAEAMPAQAQSCYPNCPPTPQPPSVTLSGGGTVAKGQTVNVVASGVNNGPAGTLTATANFSSSSGNSAGGTAKAADVGSPKVKASKSKARDRKSTRLNSSHGYISYAVFCLKKKNQDESLTI